MATSSKSKTKTIFICQQCGNTSPKWMGRCPDCGEWNSLVETVVEPAWALSGAIIGVGKCLLTS